MNDKLSKDRSLIPAERIERSILLIRGQKVMLDRDLAQLYGVETRALNQAVRRNIARFPEDFMFRLTREEIMRISQFVISSAYRIQFGSNTYRIFCFFIDNSVILTHGFVKKSQKTPAGEIERAEAYRRDFLKRRV
jgi:hypothetical protein